MSEDFTHDQTATSRAKTSQSISHVDKNDEKGVSKAKLERNNLALYARQVKAAERAVTNSDMRMRIAQEQMEINLFTLQANPADSEMSEFLQLKRQAVLNRLRAEAASSRQMEEPRESPSSLPSQHKWLQTAKSSMNVLKITLYKL
ncbi:hypothetical protein AC1031_018969 [Aphanomyces cochlioides]|nr:hypothetical protein AC1031_018969 [Aphanomyces cochlioides]